MVYEELLIKVSSLLSLDVDHILPSSSVLALGFESLIFLEFRAWIMSKLGAHIQISEIVDTTSLETLTALIVQRSICLTSGTQASSTQTIVNGNRIPVDIHEAHPLEPQTETSDAIAFLKMTHQLDFSTGFSHVPHQEHHFNANQLPKFPFPDINSLCSAFLVGVRAFATPTEFQGVMSAVEDFKRLGSIGRDLYERAADRAAEPNVSNWEWELQLQRGFLDRRVSLTPCTSFWFGHPMSGKYHAQAERAALLAHTANSFKRKLECDQVKPGVLNGQELTTAYYPWIFNAVRIPRIDRDEMRRYPNEDYCVVFSGVMLSRSVFQWKADRPAIMNCSWLSSLS